MSDGLPVLLAYENIQALMSDWRKIYLLLNTKVLEDWAYSETAPDSLSLPQAVSVTELVEAVDAFTVRRWLWEDGAMHEQREQGPLLVEAAYDSALLPHAIEHWAAIGSVAFIGSDSEFDVMHRHLASLTILALSGKGKARFAWDINTFSAWLLALDADQRLAWLGPISHLVWCAKRGPAYAWYQAKLACPVAKPPPFFGWFALRVNEQQAFDENVLNHFVDSLAHEALALPGQASTGLQRMRDRVQRIRQRAAEWKFMEDDVFHALFMFSIKHSDIFDTEQAQTELNDLKKSPQRRLRALRALVDKGEHNND